MPKLTPYDRQLLAHAKIAVDDWPEVPRADGMLSVSRNWFDAKCAETRELRIEIYRLRELAGMWKDAALMAIIGAVIWAVLWACR
jgi:hypothetical protein